MRLWRGRRSRKGSRGVVTAAAASHAGSRSGEPKPRKRSSSRRGLRSLGLSRGCCYMRLKGQADLPREGPLPFARKGAERLIGVLCDEDTRPNERCATILRIHCAQDSIAI